MVGCDKPGPLPPPFLSSRPLGFFFAPVAADAHVGGAGAKQATQEVLGHCPLTTNEELNEAVAAAEAAFASWCGGRPCSRSCVTHC